MIDRAPRCRPDDPLVPFYRLGGRPWMKGGEVKRIYFDGSPGLRGQSAWEFDNPRKMFPSGYYDVASAAWVTNHPGWTQADYAKTMSAAVKRRTLAKSLPPKDLFTSDGVLMSEGMIVMFTGGQIPGRPHWGTERLRGRLMIAGQRFTYMDSPGSVRPFGPMNIPIGEYADHRYPKSWVVHPMRPEEVFEIEGKNTVAEWSFLVVQPDISLISVDGGARFADEVPEMPVDVMRFVA